MKMGGRTLGRLRHRLGLTQTELSELLGVSFATINRWESPRGGYARGPARTFLRALDGAAREDPKLGERVAKWRRRGEAYLWYRVFQLALAEKRR